MIITGDNTINWDTFQGCSDRKNVIWIENGKVDILGYTNEKVTIDKEREILHRTQELIFLDPNKQNRTINLDIKYSTFEPIYCSDTGPQNVEVYYECNKIEVKNENEASTRKDLHNHEVGLFDLFSVELLLRLLPLELGYHNEVRAFNHMVNNTITVKIDVVGTDHISDGHKKVDTWKIDVFLGENLQTYWIAKKTKELLKQSVKIDEGTYFDFVR